MWFMVTLCSAVTALIKLGLPRLWEGRCATIDISRPSLSETNVQRTATSSHFCFFHYVSDQNQLHPDHLNGI